MPTDELNQQPPATSGEQNTAQGDATVTVEVKKKKKYPKLIPGSDLGKLMLATIVIATWKDNRHITLLWKTLEEFEADVAKFALALESKTSVETKRSPLSYKLSELNKTINRLLIFIKDELKAMFGKEAFQSYFPEFGIQYTSRSYKIPSDKSERKPALDMVVAGIEKYGLKGVNSNLAVWQALRDEYIQYTSESTLSTTTESKYVGDKVIYRPVVIKTLECLAGVIKCNYPDNYENVLRSWGFLRETY